MSIGAKEARLLLCKELWAQFRFYRALPFTFACSLTSTLHACVFRWLFLALFIYIQLKRGGSGVSGASSSPSDGAAQTFSQAARDAWKKLPSLTGSGEGRIRL